MKMKMIGIYHEQANKIHFMKHIYVSSFFIISRGMENVNFSD